MSEPDPQLQLQRLYEQLLNWTRAEALAIERSDWARLEECQQKKGLLQPEISRQEEMLAGSSQADWRQKVQPTLQQLLELEQLNQEQLGRRRIVAEQQRSQAKMVGRTLRRLHGAYVPATPAGWQSYS